MDYCSAAESAGEKRACDNLTDGVGDYPAMRDIRAEKNVGGGAGKVKKRSLARACINVINNNGREKNLRRRTALAAALTRM